jgi:hypothetical protein
LNAIPSVAIINLPHFDDANTAMVFATNVLNFAMPTRKKVMVCEDAADTSKGLVIKALIEGGDGYDANNLANWFPKVQLIHPTENDINVSMTRGETVVVVVESDTNTVVLAAANLQTGQLHQ